MPIKIRSGGNWVQVASSPSASSDTNTTYGISAADAGTNQKYIRLTAGGSSSGTDDVTLTGGDGVSLSRSGDNITISKNSSESIKGFISFTGAGNVARTHNLTVSRTGTGQYTITLDSSIRSDTNYGVVITNVSDKRWTATNTGGTNMHLFQSQDYNCWLESRSTNSFTLRARQFTDGGKHRQGHDDEWYEYVFHRVAVDPDYISLIVF